MTGNIKDIRDWKKVYHKFHDEWNCNLLPQRKTKLLFVVKKKFKIISEQH